MDGTSKYSCDTKVTPFQQIFDPLPKKKICDAQEGLG